MAPTTADCKSVKNAEYIKSDARPDKGKGDTVGE